MRIESPYSFVVIHLVNDGNQYYMLHVSNVKQDIDHIGFPHMCIMINQVTYTSRSSIPINIEHIAKPRSLSRIQGSNYTLIFYLYPNINCGRW